MTISAADWNEADAWEVRAFVGDRIEEGGTCTASVIGTGISVSVAAFADATTTMCSPMVLPAGSLPSGEHAIVVDYASPAAVGSSAPRTVAKP